MNKLLFSERSGWSMEERESLQICYTGNSDITLKLIDALKDNIHDIEKIKHAAATAEGHFAIIINGTSTCCAITDHCRSSPIFFTENMVSNDAHLLRTKAHLDTAELSGVRDAAMAGFVTGPKTLFQGLSQLEAGSLAFWNSISVQPQVEKHTIYQPTALATSSKESMADDFLSVMDCTIQDIINTAGGRPIWIPLSGGLDSRLLLAKLAEHKCDNLFAFSYGPKANDEAKVAEFIANTLGVRWQFYPTRRQDMQEFFASAERQRYWAYSDGLSSLPTFQDLITLRKLDQLGQLPEDAILINGQTGDFISGGHIPSHLIDDYVPREALLSSIIQKHFSLWSSLKTPKTLEELRCNLSERLGLEQIPKLSGEEAVALYERFEYEERQAKYVINGQRNYEYLSRDWKLPLWDKRMVAFWRDVPANLKFDQLLYKYALKRWNFRKIFDQPKTNISYWPGLAKTVLFPSRLIRLSLGRKTRDAFLKRMLYFGMYRDQYAPFSFYHFLKNAADHRSPVSLLTKTWLAGLGLPTTIHQ